MPQTDRIYLDEATEAPVLPEAADAMRAWIGRTGDPARIYREALEAREAVETAREAVGALVGATPRYVTFTSSATEALNWLVAASAQSAATLAVSVVEHSSVFDAASRARDEGSANLEVISAGALGAVDLSHLDEILAASKGAPRTVFVQHSNHETGTIQPVAEVARRCRESGATLVVDAALSAGRVPVTLDSTGADALVISAHKFGGPPGVGAVATRRGFRAKPLLVGSSQERGRRAGPENVAAIAGFGAASTTVASDLELEAKRQETLAAKIREAIAASIEKVRFLGDPECRLPHLISLQIDGVQGEPVVLGLDQAGIAVHSGSACASEVIEPSRILEAIGVESRENLRISIGRSTPDDCAGRVASEIGNIVDRLRQLAE